MDDLISRQAAIDLEPPERYERQYQTMNLDDAYESGWYDAQAGISQLPPADVRPVVRGQWTGDVCSVCGVSKYNFFHFDSHASPFGIWNFCPRCGADMRGGDADGDEKD